MSIKTWTDLTCVSLHISNVCYFLNIIWISCWYFHSVEREDHAGASEYCGWSHRCRRLGCYHFHHILYLRPSTKKGTTTRKVCMPCHFSLAYFGRWTLMIYVFPNSFEQVTVDRIQIRSRSCSSCNSFGGCRFGVESTKNDCLLHQQRPHQFTLSSGYKKVKHPNLISIDYAHALRLTGLACDPVSNTNAPINILVRSINLWNHGILSIIVNFFPFFRRVPLGPMSRQNVKPPKESRQCCLYPTENGTAKPMWLHLRKD